jgi:hypothetical protein
VTSSWRIAQPFVPTEDFFQLIVFPDTTHLPKIPVKKIVEHCIDAEVTDSGKTYSPAVVVIDNIAKLLAPSPT